MQSRRAREQILQDGDKDKTSGMRAGGRKARKRGQGDEKTRQGAGQKAKSLLLSLSLSLSYKSPFSSFLFSLLACPLLTHKHTHLLLLSY
jgi:hypothetical protein